MVSLTSSQPSFELNRIALLRKGKTTGVEPPLLNGSNRGYSPASRHITEAKAGNECHKFLYREQDPGQGGPCGSRSTVEAYVAAGHVRPAR